MRLMYCPFCGKEPVFAYEVNQNNFHTEHQVRCENPACAIKPKTEWFHDAADASNAWNIRKEGKIAEYSFTFRPVVKLDAEGNIIERFSSVRAAAEKHNYSTASVIYRCRKKMKFEYKHTGYYLRYAEDPAV